MQKVTLERKLILISLLTLAALAWLYMILPSAMVTETQIILFVVTWMVMMVAMMFPTAAPMILTFALVNRTKKQQGQPYIPTWIFVASYMVIWLIFGIIIYFILLGINNIASISEWLMANVYLGGILFIAAGLYQLSPLKKSCLLKCRTPMNFILGSWKDGYKGALLMGFEHGLYCLGCCWLLFIILFPLGLMNVAAMALITLLIFAEKSLPIGNRISVVAAGIMIVYGLLVIFVPSMLPVM